MSEDYVGRKFKTNLMPGERDLDLAGELIEVCHRFNELGLTPGNAGNMSVRTNRGILVTPGGKNKGLLTVDDLVEVLSFNGVEAEAIGSLEPTSEVPMHWGIYDAFTGVNAVVHVHDDMIVGNPPEGIPVTRETSYGTAQQAGMVVDALRRSDYIVIKGHGVVGVGETLESAAQRVLGIHCAQLKR